MQSILNILAFWYGFFLELAHIPLAAKTIINTAVAGYDKETQQARANEAIGLKMLEDAITQEIRTAAVRDLTDWEITRNVYVGARAGVILRLASWDSERIGRKVSQIVARLEEEIQGVRE